MKRALPFLIIGAVALLTFAAGAMLYRAKQRPVAQQAVAPTPPADQTQDGSMHVRGPRSAPVTLEVFADFQCPSCAKVSGVISEVEGKYGARLRVIFREFPLAMHAHAVEAALAAEAAGLQGRFWEMHDMLYKYQSVWSKVSDVGHFFNAYAESLGLDVARFQADSQSANVRARVISEGNSGVARGVKNTPTLFINGREVGTPFTREKLQEAIDAALAQGKNA